MSGRLAKIEAEVTRRANDPNAHHAWRAEARDVLLLVEIARAAQNLAALDEIWDDTAEFDALRAALARLDATATEQPHG